MTVEHLRERGVHGDRAAYRRFLESSADAPPLPGRRIVNPGRVTEQPKARSQAPPTQTAASARLAA